MKKANLYKPIISISLAIFLTQLFFACTGTGEKKSTDLQKIIPGTKILSKPPSSFSDTLMIATPAAVFYNPDSLQLEKIKSIYNKNVFESVTHESFYQMKNARLVLKKYWPQIQVIETSKVRYLQFIKKDKSKMIIDLNTKNDISGIFLFDTKKDPELIDMMNIDTALGFYFKK